MTTILLNGLSAVAARLAIPGTGAWIADVDVDLALVPVVPSGRAVLVIGTETLLGTVDASGTGRMGEKARVQLVGGGGGWARNVPALHLHNDFGVTSTAVYSVTAASVGEVVLDTAPTVYGPDFVRSAGPASRVLAGVNWYVDATGITTVGPRLPRPLGLGVDILEWDPATKRAVLASDTIVWPGTLLVDERFGTATVRDVEQTFGPDGARVIAWCETGSDAGLESAGSRLARALGAVARESTGLPFLRRYKYRVVAQGVDGRLTLQAVAIGAGVPDLLQAIPIWPGVAGVEQKLVPGSIVLVAFVARDAPLPPMPVVVGFDPDNPTALEVSVDTLIFKVGLGAMPVAKAPPVITALSALQTQLTALNAGLAATAAGLAVLAGDPTHAATPTTAAIAAATTAATAAGTAVGSGATAVSSAVSALPSPKSFTD